MDTPAARQGIFVCYHDRNQSITEEAYHLIERTSGPIFRMETCEQYETTK